MTRNTSSQILSSVWSIKRCWCWCFFFSNISLKKNEENKQEKALHINLNDNLHLHPIIYIQITPLFFSCILFSIYSVLFILKFQLKRRKHKQNLFFFFALSEYITNQTLHGFHKSINNHIYSFQFKTFAKFKRKPKTFQRFLVCLLSLSIHWSLCEARHLPAH